MNLIDSEDTTSVALTAAPDFTEDGTTLTYTVTLGNEVRTGDAPVVVNFTDLLGDARSITVNSGAIATLDVAIPESAFEDVYDEAPVDLLIASGVSVSGGSFEDLGTPSVGTVNLIDSEDTTTVTLSVSDVNVVDGIVNVTFTATLSNPGLTDVTLTTEHGDIPIVAGSTTGSIEVPFGTGSEVSATVSTLTGGLFEDDDVSAASASVPVASVVEAIDLDGMPNFNAGTPIATGTLTGNSFLTTSTSDYGTFTVNSTTGDWAFALDNTLDATNQLKADEVKTESFEVTVDGETQYVIVKVNGANDTPNAEDANYSAFNTDTISGINLADKTTDVEDDASSVVTKIKITDFPDFGDLYDADGNVLTVGSEVLDTADIRYTIDPNIDLTPSFNAQDDFKDDNGNRIANNTVSSITLINGLVISGGTFNGAVPVEFGESSLAGSGDTLTAANLYYDSANNETGLGVGSDRELNSSNKEYISIEFPHDVTSADLYFGSVYGNYQDRKIANEPDAQINVIALKDGEVVGEFSFNDTHNGSGEFSTPIFIVNPEFKPESESEELQLLNYDELRVFTLADVNSNITFQGVEVTNMTVNDSFDYEAVDSKGVVEGATVSLSTTFSDTSPYHLLTGDEDGLLYEPFNIVDSGELTLIQNYDVADDRLDISAIVDDTVTKDNLDQYLKLAFVDDDGDGSFESTLLTIDSNGDKSGGSITNVFIQNVVDDQWIVIADSDAKGNFDLDD